MVGQTSTEATPRTSIDEDEQPVGASYHVDDNGGDRHRPEEDQYEEEAPQPTLEDADAFVKRALGDSFFLHSTKAERIPGAFIFGNADDGSSSAPLGDIFSSPMQSDVVSLGRSTSFADRHESSENEEQQAVLMHSVLNDMLYLGQPKSIQSESEYLKIVSSVRDVLRRQHLLHNVSSTTSSVTAGRTTTADQGATGTSFSVGDSGQSSFDQPLSASTTATTNKLSIDGAIRALQSGAFFRSRSNTNEEGGGSISCSFGGDMVESTSTAAVPSPRNVLDDPIATALAQIEHNKSQVEHEAVALRQAKNFVVPYGYGVRIEKKKCRRHSPKHSQKGSAGVSPTHRVTPAASPSLSRSVSPSATPQPDDHHDSSSDDDGEDDEERAAALGITHSATVKCPRVLQHLIRLGGGVGGGGSATATPALSAAASATQTPTTSHVLPPKPLEGMALAANAVVDECCDGDVQFTVSAVKLGAATSTTAPSSGAGAEVWREFDVEQVGDFRRLVVADNKDTEWIKDPKGNDFGIVSDEVRESVAAELTRKRERWEMQKQELLSSSIAFGAMNMKITRSHSSSDAPEDLAAASAAGAARRRSSASTSLCYSAPAGSPSTGFVLEELRPRHVAIDGEAAEQLEESAANNAADDDLEETSPPTVEGGDANDLTDGALPADTVASTIGSDEAPVGAEKKRRQSSVVSRSPARSPSVASLGSSSGLRRKSSMAGEKPPLAAKKKASIAATTTPSTTPGETALTRKQSTVSFASGDADSSTTPQQQPLRQPLRRKSSVSGTAPALERKASTSSSAAAAGLKKKGSTSSLATTSTSSSASLKKTGKKSSAASSATLKGGGDQKKAEEKKTKARNEHHDDEAPPSAEDGTAAAGVIVFQPFSIEAELIPKRTSAAEASATIRFFQSVPFPLDDDDRVDFSAQEDLSYFQERDDADEYAEAHDGEEDDAMAVGALCPATPPGTPTGAEEDPHHRHHPTHHHHDRDHHADDGLGVHFPESTIYASTFQPLDAATVQSQVAELAVLFDDWEEQEKELLRAQLEEKHAAKRKKTHHKRKKTKKKHDDDDHQLDPHDDTEASYDDHILASEGDDDDELDRSADAATEQVLLKSSTRALLSSAEVGHFVSEVEHELRYVPSERHLSAVLKLSLPSLGTTVEALSTAGSHDRRRAGSSRQGMRASAVTSSLFDDNGSPLPVSDNDGADFFSRISATDGEETDKSVSSPCKRQQSKQPSSTAFSPLFLVALNRQLRLMQRQSRVIPTSNPSAPANTAVAASRSPETAGTTHIDWAKVKRINAAWKRHHHHNHGGGALTRTGSLSRSASMSKGASLALSGATFTSGADLLSKKTTSKPAFANETDLMSFGPFSRHFLPRPTVVSSGAASSAYHNVCDNVDCTEPTLKLQRQFLRASTPLPAQLANLRRVPRDVELRGGLDAPLELPPQPQTQSSEERPRASTAMSTTTAGQRAWPELHVPRKGVEESERAFVASRQGPRLGLAHPEHNQDIHEKRRQEQLPEESRQGDIFPGGHPSRTPGQLSSSALALAASPSAAGFGVSSMIGRPLSVASAHTPPPKPTGTRTGTLLSGLRSSSKRTAMTPPAASTQRRTSITPGAVRAATRSSSVVVQPSTPTALPRTSLPSLPLHLLSPEPESGLTPQSLQFVDDGTDVHHALVGRTSTPMQSNKASAKEVEGTDEVLVRRQGELLQAQQQGMKGLHTLAFRAMRPSERTPAM